ncbi:fimbria/pilus outer membrane usher protein [Spirochaeta dissipatitropha]
MLSSVFRTRTSTIQLLILILILNTANEASSPVYAQSPKDLHDLQEVYVPLVLNQQLHDDVLVLIDPESMDLRKIHTDAFEIIRSALRPELIDAILSSAVQHKGNMFVSIETAAKEGIIIVLDQQDSLVIIRPQPGTNVLQDLSVQKRNQRIPETLQPGSKLSIFANIDATLEYRSSDASASNSHRLPATISADSGITLAPEQNNHNHNFYGRVTYAHHLDPALNLDDARYRLDLPHNLISMQIGTTALPQFSLIREQSILGVVLAHNDALQPLRITRSLGRSSIYLDSPSRVRIFVNNRMIDQLHLPAGEFDIQDIPLPAGQNTIRLEISDDMQRSEVLHIEAPHNPKLQVPGSNRYALGGGIAENNPEHWQIAAYMQRGMHEKWTAGFGATIASGEILAAFSSIHSTALGNFNLDLAGYMEAVDEAITYGSMAQLEYQLLFPERNTSPRILAGARIQGPRIRTPSERPNQGNRDAVSLYTTIAQSLTRNTGITGTLRGNLRRDPAESSAQAILTLGHYLERGANLLMRGSVELFESSDPRGQLSISYSYTPDQSSRRPAASISHDMIEPRTSISLSSNVYQQAGTLLSATGAVQNINMQDPSVDGYSPASGSAALRLSTPVFESSLRGSHDFNRGDATGRSNLAARAAVGLLYADGAATLSRPNRDAFVIVVPHPLFRDFDVGLRSERGSAVARLYPWGSGGIANLKSYAYHTLAAEVSELPEGYSLGVDRFHINPGFQQGTRIVVGSDANLTVALQLQTAEGHALPLAAGWLYAEQDKLEEKDEQEERVRFFSNRDGTVELYGLRHGSYRLVLLDGRSGNFEIPPDTAGRIQLDAVKME